MMVFVDTTRRFMKIHENMKYEDLNTSLKSKIEYYKDNPESILVDQVDFWIRDNKIGKSFTNDQLIEIKNFSNDLIKRFKFFIEKKEFDNLEQEKTETTNQIQKKVIFYNSLEKKYIRNAYVNLETCLSGMYEMSHSLFRLESAEGADLCDLIFKIGTLDSELNFVTGLKVSSQERATSGAGAKQILINSFEAAMKKFVSDLKLTDLKIETLYDILVKKVDQLNLYLETVNGSFSVKFDSNIDQLLFAFGKQKRSIRNPLSDKNAYSKLKKFI